MYSDNCKKAFIEKLNMLIETKQLDNGGIWVMLNEMLKAERITYQEYKKLTIELLETDKIS